MSNVGSTLVIFTGMPLAGGGGNVQGPCAHNMIMAALQRGWVGESYKIRYRAGHHPHAGVSRPKLSNLLFTLADAALPTGGGSFVTMYCAMLVLPNAAVDWLPQDVIPLKLPQVEWNPRLARDQ